MIKRLLRWFLILPHDWRELKWQESPYFVRECRRCETKEYRQWRRDDAGHRYVNRHGHIGNSVCR